MAIFFDDDTNNLTIIGEPDVSVDRAFNNLKGIYVDLINQNGSLKEQIRQLKSDIAKDEEVKKLQAELDKMRKEGLYSFHITGEEHKRIAKWQEQHLKDRHSCNMSFGAIGGNWEYTFLPTSVIDIGSCRCGLCDRIAFNQAMGDRDRYCELMRQWDAILDLEDDF